MKKRLGGSIPSWHHWLDQGDVNTISETKLWCFKGASINDFDWMKVALDKMNGSRWKFWSLHSGTVNHGAPPGDILQMLLKCDFSQVMWQTDYACPLVWGNVSYRVFSSFLREDGFELSLPRPHAACQEQMWIKKILPSNPWGSSTLYQKCWPREIISFKEESINVVQIKCKTSE